MESCLFFLHKLKNIHHDVVYLCVTACEKVFGIVSCSFSVHIKCLGLYYVHVCCMNTPPPNPSALTHPETSAGT